MGEQATQLCQRKHHQPSTWLLAPLTSVLFNFLSIIQIFLSFYSPVKGQDSFETANNYNYYD